MKHFWISCLLLALTLGLCIGSACTVNQVMADTGSHLEEAVDLWRHGERILAAEALDDAASKWCQYDVFLGTVLRHDQIDGVLQDFAKLQSYTETDSTEEFLSTCASLLSQLQHLKEMEWPHLKNIL